MKTPWIIKYQPKCFTDLVFSTDIHFRVLKYLKTHENGGVLHVTGDCGVGKSILIKLVAKALKYNIIEIFEEDICKISEFIKNKVSISNGYKNLLLIDGINIKNNFNNIKLMENTRIPIVIISNDLYLKDIYTLKIEQANIDDVKLILNKIFKYEKFIVENKVIYKICEICRYDLRSVINNVQLISYSPSVKLINNMEKIINENIINKCKNLFKKRMKYNELINIYSSKLFEYSYNSLLINCKEFNIINKIIINNSVISNLNMEYQFLKLEQFNNVRNLGLFTFKKDSEIYEKSDNLENENKNYIIRDYLSKYVKNIYNEKSFNHFKKIFDFYKFKNISIENQNFINLKYSETPIRKLKYKHNYGFSNAVKRDISLWEILK